MTKFPLKEFLQIILYPTLFLILCWGIFFCDVTWHLNLAQYGVGPRTASGLIGVLFAPLIHGDLNHIASNSLPLLVLGSLLFYFYKPIAWPSIIWMYLISGLWLWVGGRNNDEGSVRHIGASTLIYAFASFLFFSGVFRKHKPLMVVSALVALLYGSITWAVFPFDQTISWEGHLFGALSGLLVAYNYRKEGPQAQEYVWEEDGDDDDPDMNPESEDIFPADPADDLSSEKPSTDPFTITYHFVPKNKENDDV